MATENLRSDAKLNRDRLVEVAQDALAYDPQASLNSIAKAAGVGAGTLYRHFPTRASLVLTVYHREIQDLVALAPELVATHPPLEAFRLWCRRLALFGRMKHGLGDTLHTAMTDQDYQETYGPMVAAIDLFLAAGASSGDFNPRIDPEDFLLLLGFLWRIKPVDEAETQADRLLDIVFHGLSRI